MNDPVRIDVTEYHYKPSNINRMKQLFIIILSFTAAFGLSQNNGIIPVQVKEKFSDFTLNDHNGNSVQLSELKGRKVMLVFIRGKVTPQTWCPVCHYQYLEIMQAQESQDIMKMFNMELYFIFPYSADSLNSWKQAFSASIKTIEKWKNPPSTGKTSQGQLDWAEYCKKFFSHTFTVPENVDLKIPVLIDADQELSKGVMLYKHEWGGTKVEQNIPTVFIIDENGFVQFKYHSQYTNDRPDAEYLIKYIKNMM